MDIGEFFNVSELNRSILNDEQLAMAERCVRHSRAVCAKYGIDNIFAVNVDGVPQIVKIEALNPHIEAICELFKKLDSPLFLKNTPNPIFVSTSEHTIYHMNIANDCVRKCAVTDVYYYRGLFNDIYTQLIELHKLGIVHGDVKSSNILEYDKFFTLCDFDFCGSPTEIYSIKNTAENFALVKYFVTIGALDGRNFGHTKKGDLFSLIVVFFMMFCDCKAYMKELNDFEYTGDIYESTKQMVAIRTRYIETQLLPLQIKEITDLYAAID